MVPTAPVSRYKKRTHGSPPAINAEFEIDPMANAGVPFAFDEVVRGRQHRHVLDAGDCEECRDVRSPPLLYLKTKTHGRCSGTRL